MQMVHVGTPSRKHADGIHATGCSTMPAPSQQRTTRAQANNLLHLLTRAQYRCAAKMACRIEYETGIVQRKILLERMKPAFVGQVTREPKTPDFFPYSKEFHLATPGLLLPSTALLLYLGSCWRRHGTHGAVAAQQRRS